MKLRSLFLLSLLALVPVGRADVISEWSRTGLAYLDQNVPNHSERGMAMLHVAQFDAVNAVLGGYTPYAVSFAAPKASPEAAAARAAYTVLTNLSRANLSVLNTALTQSLAAVPDGPAKDDGILLGQQIAQAVIRLRAADNPDLNVPAASSTALGRWRPTPPNLAAGFGAHLRYLSPWTLRSAAQFRPAPPPALTNATYTADYNEIRVRGARNRLDRPPDEASSARFHDSIGVWDYMSVITAHRDLPLIESARVFALANLVMADGMISVFETKYAYNLWRPITAIRLGETDDNDTTPGEPAWNSYLDTHPHPEYPSAACINTTAFIEVLISVYGDDFPLTIRASASNTTRSFTRLSDIIADVTEGRIIAGMHFRNSCVVGVEMGRQIARQALQNFLRPVPHLTPAALNAEEFQLHLMPGQAVPYLIETSNDLLQWLPWQTNIFGMLALKDTNAAATDRRFYRLFTMP